MSFEIWLIYLGTIIAMMSTPGPSHILMLSNSLGHGFKKSIYTAFGDLSANFLQMIAASIGLVSVLQKSQQVFIYIKWAGVVYLMYLGLKLIFSKSKVLDENQNIPRSEKSLYWQGFITSAVNPKAVIFFAALFPQFIIPSEPLLPQFIILSLTYLIIDGLYLSFYGKFAEFFAKKMNSTIGKYFNQISGSLFIGAAIVLGLKDFERK